SEPHWYVVAMTPRFGTVLTAMVTPLTDAGEVDLNAAATLARFLVDSGSDGLVVAGSTGEGSALANPEKLDLFAAVAGAVSVPVLAGTSSSDTYRSVNLTRQVAATGAAGVLATTPAYARPSQAGIAGHLGAMAAATDLPIMLYDIPSRTGRKIASATTIGLVHDHANVVALKDASGDLPGAAHVKAVLGDALDLYSGDDAMTLPFMAIGAVGIVSVAAHWAGPEFAAMVRAFEKGDLDAARGLNERLGASYAFESSEAYPNPMPSKAAMRHLGFAVGECRWPLGPGDADLDAAAARVVDALMATRG
ncbi:MAG: 4-hydroxy-tetrahydrodipicolinate synthase, partial [Acidimicrobiales bacterium]